MNVNIYIETDVRGARAKLGHGMYLLECEIEGKPYTKNGLMTCADVTSNLLELRTLIEALKRMQKSATIRIFTRNEHLFTTLDNCWNIQWEKNNWCNARGRPVKNAEEWQQITELLREHTYTITKESHSYRTWMMMELKKGE